MINKLQYLGLVLQFPFAKCDAMFLFDFAFKTRNNQVKEHLVSKGKMIHTNLSIQIFSVANVLQL